MPETPDVLAGVLMELEKTEAETQVFEDALAHMGLSPRKQQTALVGHARAAITDDSRVLVQAGTGVGKSFAILSVALEAARENSMPSVVVCPTNALVNQYVEKDAPRIAKVTGGKFEYLKGRSNYLCTSSYGMFHDVDGAVRDDEFLSLTADGQYEWSQHGLPNTWGCSGDCERCRCACLCGKNKCCLDTMRAGKCCCNRCDGDQCAVQLARARAQTAEVVVTNGHLLVWDYRVIEMTHGQSRLLPEFGALFIDECHEVEGVGRSCYSDQIGPGSSVYSEVEGLRPWVEAVTKEMNERDELAVGSVASIEPLIDDINYAHKRVKDLADLLEASHGDKSLRKEYKREMKSLLRFLNFVNHEDPQFVSTITLEWSDKDKKMVPMLNLKCVDVALQFRRILTNQATLMTSGTVPVTLSRRLGVAEAEFFDVGTPFDYSKSQLVISNLSGKFGANNDYDRACQMADAITAASTKGVNGEAGGTLILFSSWRDLDNVMPMVMSKIDSSIPVFGQSKTDQRDTAEMVESFKAHGNAVLCGVQSLWTGIDIPGSALKQVIIYKLPWPVPTIESKAIEAIHGRQVYVDQMLQLLTQGIGRLVRTTEDSGRVFIVDSRARSQRWTSNQMTKHVAGFQKAY